MLVREYMAELLYFVQKNKMAAAAILDFCTMRILAVNLTGDPVTNLCFKFGANACKNGRVMAKNVIFNMAAAAILDFVGYEF